MLRTYACRISFVLVGLLGASCSGAEPGATQDAGAQDANVHDLDLAADAAPQDADLADAFSMDAAFDAATVDATTSDALTDAVVSIEDGAPADAVPVTTPFDVVADAWCELRASCGSTTEHSVCVEEIAAGLLTDAPDAALLDEARVSAAAACLRSASSCTDQAAADCVAVSIGGGGIVTECASRAATCPAVELHDGQCTFLAWLTDEAMATAHDCLAMSACADAAACISTSIH